MDGRIDGQIDGWSDGCLLIMFKTTDLPKGHNRLGDWVSFLDY